jgi:hypothetical protein
MWLTVKGMPAVSPTEVVCRLVAGCLWWMAVLLSTTEVDIAHLRFAITALYGHCRTSVTPQRLSEPPVTTRGSDLGARAVRDSP